MRPSIFAPCRSIALVLCLALGLSSPATTRGDCVGSIDISAEGYFWTVDPWEMYSGYWPNLGEWLADLAEAIDWIDWLGSNEDYVAFFGTIYVENPDPNCTYEMFAAFNGAEWWIGEGSLAYIEPYYPYYDGYLTDAWAIEYFDHPATDGIVAAIDNNNSQRYATNGGTLKMVSHLGATRMAALGIIPDCETFFDGYPVWNGATYGTSDPRYAVYQSSGGSTNISVNLGAGHTAGTVHIDVVPSDPDSYTYSAGTFLSAITSKLGLGIETLFGTSFSIPNPTGGGGLSIETRLVDDYQDASRTGVRVEFGGSLSGSWAGFEIQSPPLPIGGGFNTRFKFGVTGLEASLSGSGIHDPSLASPGGVNLEATGGASISGTGVVQFAGLCSVGSVTGSTGISITLSGPGSNFPQSAALSGNLAIGHLSVNITLGVEFEGMSCNALDIDFDSESALEIPLGPWTIYER